MLMVDSSISCLEVFRRPQTKWTLLMDPVDPNVPEFDESDDSDWNGNCEADYFRLLTLNVPGRSIAWANRITHNTAPSERGSWGKDFRQDSLSDQDCSYGYHRRFKSSIFLLQAKVDQQIHAFGVTRFTRDRKLSFHRTKRNVRWHHKLCTSKTFQIVL